MYFLNRSKKVIVLALLIALMPAQAQAWSFTSLWNTIKENAWVAAVGVCAAAFVFLYKDYSKWKAHQDKQKKTQKPSTETKPQFNAKKTYTKLDSQKLRSGSQGFTADATLNRQGQSPHASASAQTAIGLFISADPYRSSNEANSQITQSSQPIKLQAIKGLEKELEELIEQKETMPAEEFEAQRFVIGAKLFNLTLRYNNIHAKFNDRFSLEKIKAVLEKDNLPQSLYVFLACTQGTSIEVIHTKINEMVDTPLKELLRKMFSCSYAKENYDAFLAGREAISQLEITDERISGRITTLFQLANSHKKNAQSRPQPVNQQQQQQPIDDSRALSVDA